MEWYEVCHYPTTVTRRYEEVPALDPFPIFDWQVLSSRPTLRVGGYLPRLPDHLDLADGLIPERAELYLTFGDISDLESSGWPEDPGGELQIVKEGDDEVRFHYESPTFRFRGACRGVSITGVGIDARFDPDHRKPRGPRLFSHYNVFNTCLLLLREYGYSLRALGHVVHRDSPARLTWHAEKEDGTRLTGNSPIELLGLVGLHRHHRPEINEDYWWRLEGPNVVRELIDAWEKEEGLDLPDEPGPEC